MFLQLYLGNVFSDLIKNVLKHCTSLDQIKVL